MANWLTSWTIVEGHTCEECSPGGVAQWETRPRTCLVTRGGRSIHVDLYGRVTFAKHRCPLDEIISLRESARGTFGKKLPRYVTICKSPDTSLSDEIAIMLEELDLHTVAIRSGVLEHVSELLSQCVTLKNLSFRSNRLHRLPSLERMTYLRMLDVSRNQLREIPAGLEHLKWLSTLNLRDNLLTDIPCWKDGRLYELDVSGNDIDIVPDRISEHCHLYSLSLARNRIRSLPGSISSLCKLRYLNVRNNQLRGLPVFLARCKRLEHIILKDNPIVYIPRRLCAARRLARVTLGDLHHLRDPPCEVRHGWHSICAYMRNLAVREQWTPDTHCAMPPAIHELVGTVMLARLSSLVLSSIPLEIWQSIFTHVLNAFIVDEELRRGPDPTLW